MGPLSVVTLEEEAREYALFADSNSNFFLQTICNLYCTNRTRDLLSDLVKLSRTTLITQERRHERVT